jgi:molybdopterin converting factor subunit 1
MRLHLKFFASFREAVGAREVDLDLPDGMLVRDLLLEMRHRYPGLDATLDQGLVAVNHEYVAHDVRLADGDEVGLIPPVSGGA